jgi:hypothetical protein
MPKVAGSAKLLWGAARDMPNLEPERKPVVLCGQQAPLDEMRAALGVERDQPGISLYGVRRLRATDHDQLERAAVVVYGGVVMNDLDAPTRDDLRVVGRTQRPVLALLEALELPTPAAAAAGRVRGVAPTDVLPYRRGSFPQNLALQRPVDRSAGSRPAALHLRVHHRDRFAAQRQGGAADLRPRRRHARADGGADADGAATCALLRL